MNSVDPKWLEIIKASGWQTTALAIACLLTFLLVKWGYIPAPDESRWMAWSAVGSLIFGLLSLASVGAWLVKVTHLQDRISQWFLKRSEAKAASEFIPFMTEKDREIIGYLLHHSQKIFQYTQDGGHAAPLISKGFVRLTAVYGQSIGGYEVPFEIPDHIWHVFKENQCAFPYNPPDANKTEVFPWAVSWMAR